MSIRTDLTTDPITGRIVSAAHVRNDSTKPLPRLEGTDMLISDRYGEVWKKEAGPLSDDLALSALAQAQASVARTFQSFAEIREHRDPAKTQALHLNELAASFERSLKGLATQSDRAREAARKRLDSIETEFKHSIRWNTQDAQELRSVLRYAEPEQRSKIISEAIAAGDGQVLGAVLGSHPTLSGLTAEHQRAYRQQAMAKHRPDLLSLERVLQKAERATFQSFTDLLERSESITAASVRKQYDLEKRAAKEAQDRLKAATPTLY